MGKKNIFTKTRPKTSLQRLHNTSTSGPFFLQNILKSRHLLYFHITKCHAYNLKLSSLYQKCYPFPSGHNSPAVSLSLSPKPILPLWPSFFELPSGWPYTFISLPHLSAQTCSSRLSCFPQSLSICCPWPNSVVFFSPPSESVTLCYFTCSSSCLRKVHVKIMGTTLPSFIRLLAIQLHVKSTGSSHLSTVRSENQHR